MCDKNLNETNSDDSLLKELKRVWEILNSLIYDWEKVTDQLIGLWQNYAGNPDIPKEQKKRANELIHQSVYALRKLAENQEYLQNTRELVEQALKKAKELNS